MFFSCTIRDFFLISLVKTVHKIQVLIELTDKQFKKKFNLSCPISLDSEISKDFFFSLKKFYQFYLLCLMELCTKLSETGLGFLTPLLMLLFQSFKIHMAFFMKFNVFFFKMKNLYTEKESKNLGIDLDPPNIVKIEEFSQEELAFLRRFLKYQKAEKLIKENKYERIEKAQFYLEQEVVDLEKMLLDFNVAKDEVEEFLKKKNDIKKFKPSGVTKFLYSLVRDTKAQTVTNNFELETGIFLTI